MSDPTKDLILTMLQHLVGKLDELRADMREVKQRTASLDTSLARLHGNFVGQASRFDRMDARLERIERRLDPADPR